MSRTNNRLGEIDTLRALAILLVIGFHWGSRWSVPFHTETLYPYGDSVANWMIFRRGYLGVELFFIVSGFVIALTLERCKDLLEFSIRRLARLLPSMIVCSIATLLITKYVFPVEPFSSSASWINIIPSWTFINPRLWSILTPNVAYIDGVYWSLFVELKFYFWAAILYFLFKRNFSIIFMTFSTFILLFSIIGNIYDIDLLLTLEAYLFFGDYAMLFAAGVIFWRIFKNDQRSNLVNWLLVLYCFTLEVIVLYISNRNIGNFWTEISFVTVFFITFSGFAAGVRLPETLPLNLLSKVGLASYPLYLLHQNIGVSVIHSIGPSNSPIVMITFVIGLAVGLALVSYAIHRWVEEPGKNILMTFQRLRGVGRA